MSVLPEGITAEQLDRIAVLNAAMLAYVRAMIDVHAQQTVLSTLLDVLGHEFVLVADVLEHLGSVDEERAVLCQLKFTGSATDSSGKGPLFMAK